MCITNCPPKSVLKSNYASANTSTCHLILCLDVHICLWCVLQIINMILELKIKVKLDKICNTTHNMNSSFISTTVGVHIWHNDCLWVVDYNIGVLSLL